MLLSVRAVLTVCLMPLVAGSVTNTAPSQSSASSAYPSYADYAGKPYNVSYDKRSLMINGQHALFISGAIHPPRGTPEMWKTWLSEAKSNNLNMVQVYIFWNYHEPVEGQFDFSERGNLTLFMAEAASAGIFVNLRIGPYVCAEWTYGGLPAWLGQKPGVAFRQTNAVWQPAMEKWFNQIVDMMAVGKFFASQGGPIVLVQVENELPKTDQQYVQWCGDIAHAALKKANVNVPVTMCNGETADNAINTCNGNDCTGFLESHGQNGRVLVDQPALWTENEGGFQTWGGAPPPGKEPYFWGRPIADQGHSVMKWFARGGSHMNYYMWTGGNNYGRWTGDSITHMYAVDAIVCPDGLRHEPKFSQTTKMHAAIAQAAQYIVAKPAQLNNPIKVQPGIAMYDYSPIAFLESLLNTPTNVIINGSKFTVSAGGSALIDLNEGKVIFDTGVMSDDVVKSPRRKIMGISDTFEWKAWAEPIESSSVKPNMYPAASLFSSQSPIEMTNLTSALTTFAFYETEVPSFGPGTKFDFPTVNSQAFVTFLDGQQASAVDDHSHGNGSPKTLTSLVNGTGGSSTVTITILAEELGYANYGFKEELYKGIHGGTLQINGKDVDGPWKMRGGLAGEHLDIMSSVGSDSVAWTSVPNEVPAGTWLQTKFNTPATISDGVNAPQLLLQISGLGRGRIWINGIDLGRYWSLTRNDASACPNGDSECPTQQYYHVPAAWLSTTGENLLTVFESLGATPGATFINLAQSSLTDMTGAPVSVSEVVSCEF